MTSLQHWKRIKDFRHNNPTTSSIRATKYSLLIIEFQYSEAVWIKIKSEKNTVSEKLQSH